MRLSIANISESIPDDTFEAAVRAIQRQIREHFAPAWGMDASLRLLRRLPRDAQPDPEVNRSDVILYVGEQRDDGTMTVGDAVGYHSHNHRGVPYGFVFADVAARLGQPWTAALSHEVMELIADPEVNLMVVAPHPRDPERRVLRPYEVCDPVQGDRYSLEGVEVSNFVTPLYFADLPHPTRTRTNHLGLRLPRFGVRPGGYFSYLDPTTWQYHEEYGDPVGGPELARHKQALGAARRQARRVAALGRISPGR